MKVRRNIVNFYFDKNIWSKIATMTEAERASFDALVEPLKREAKIGMYYSPIGVLELIKGGLLEKHYEKCQKEVRLASEITGKHILDNPWDHIGRIACIYMGKPFKEPDTSFLNLCREIAVLSYSQMKYKIARLRKAARWEKRWAEQLTKLKSGMRKNFGLKPRDKARRAETDEFRSVRGVLLRRMKYWRFFCRHFRLPSQLEEVSFENAFARFHSFRYWVDYRITYENKIIYQNKKPKPSDYFDWEQLVYLNIMDYLVTNDEGLRKILRESINPHSSLTV